jgi:hypothetical protein
MAVTIASAVPTEIETAIANGPVTMTATALGASRTAISPAIANAMSPGVTIGVTTRRASTHRIGQNKDQSLHGAPILLQQLNARRPQARAPTATAMISLDLTAAVSLAADGGAAAAVADVTVQRIRRRVKTTPVAKPDQSRELRHSQSPRASSH